RTDNAGDLSVTDLITPAGTSTLSLITGGALIDAHDPGPFTDLQVTNLALQAVNGIGLNILDLRVDTVAMANTGTGSIDISENLGDLIVGVVDGVVGVTNGSTSGGAFTSLTIDSGDLTVNRPIAGGSTEIDLATYNGPNTITNNS